MQIFRSLLAALPALLAVRGSAISARQSGVSNGGTIVTPAAGSTITDGQPFPLHYQNINICHSGYSQIHVYLTATAPTTEDVSSSGTIADPLFDYGSFLIANFGLPIMDPVPPATLTAPALAEEGEIFLAVVETFRDCPPDGHIAYGLSSIPVEYEA